MNASTQAIAWPPIYKVKKHRQAKRVKLKTSIQHGLEIVVPYRFNLKHIPAILEENKLWITKQLLKLVNTQTFELPKALTLCAMNQTWMIRYETCNAKLVMMELSQNTLAFIGHTHQKMACKKMLISWLKKQAKLHLPVLLKIVSDKTGLHFETVTIRSQQTRWGSCTAKRNLSLNYKLILLPTHLVEHVLIHELCHTVYLNHSAKFWRLVAQLDPNWQIHKKELHRADQYIPKFLF